MPTILAIAAFLLLATDALNIELSILPGFSAKNMMIYGIATLIALRMVMNRTSIMAATVRSVSFVEAPSPATTPA